MPHATTLRIGQIRHLLRVTEATSRHPECNCLVLFAWPDLWHESVRKSSDRNSRRYVFIRRSAHRRKPPMGQYIGLSPAQHLSNPQTNGRGAGSLRGLPDRARPGTELVADRYRELSPATAQVLTHKSSRFDLNTERRINYAGEQVDYLACDNLQAHITKLYRDAGIKGSSHSGRRSFASNLLRNGASLDVVQQLLGHELDHVMTYLEVQQDKWRAMFLEVI